MSDLTYIYFTFRELLKSTGLLWDISPSFQVPPNPLEVLLVRAQPAAIKIMIHVTTFKIHILLSESRKKASIFMQQALLLSQCLRSGIIFGTAFHSVVCCCF